MTKTFISFLLAALISTSIMANEKPITTVILIQGEPHLVDLAQDGDIVVSYGKVPSYFTSMAQHDDIVERSVAKYKEYEKNISRYIRFIAFDQSDYVLDETMVDYIRAMAVQLEDDKESTATITVAYNNQTRDLSANRAKSIMNLLEEFGIDSDRIAIAKKKYLGSEPNQFMKLEIHPSL